jgi:N-methylhydantoinase B
VCSLSADESNRFDPIRLEVFKHLFSALAEEMGAVLRKASFSPNIKERRDYSCAVFDAQGRMIAQAAHIPVHLGSMPLSVAAAVQKMAGDLQPGDSILLNDPYLGGTHLPDITLVTPVYIHNPGSRPNLIGFTASRAHHADVGGMTPGSMPVAREIFQEGLIIPPVKLIRQGEINQAVLAIILANVRTPQERQGDLQAQIAANQRGARRLAEMAARYGKADLEQAMAALLAYTERLTRRLLAQLADGVYCFEDDLDDDGVTCQTVRIRVCITIHGDQAEVDFSGSAPQVKGSLNAVEAITLSAVYYVFRCLIGLDAPNNAGCLAPIRVHTPPGSVVNAQRPSAVAGGNVETSQRIVDVLLGALAQAAPERIPAASQGTMNNVTIGGWNNRTNQPFAYYETVGGGMGARPDSPGPSAIHSHMTNTLNTPVEALEYAYPLRVRRYEVRVESGGGGRWRGGDGIRRDIELLCDAQVTLLTERRFTRPYGLQGGDPGLTGENRLIRGGVESNLPTPTPGKGTLELLAGDILSLRTPGGGGLGKAD